MSGKRWRSMREKNFNLKQSGSKNKERKNKKTMKAKKKTKKRKEFEEVKKSLNVVWCMIERHMCIVLYRLVKTIPTLHYKHVSFIFLFQYDATHAFFSVHTMLNLSLYCRVCFIYVIIFFVSACVDTQTGISMFVRITLFKC